MHRWGLSLALPLGAAVLVAQEAPAPPASQKVPLPTFPGRVEQVTVDVVVTDKKGVPLTGLGKDDLEVFEDGVRQAVVSFEAVQVPPVASAAPPPRPRVSTNQERQDVVGRTFVVLFDDVHLSASTAQRAKAAVADFLGRGVREGDRVTLVATMAGTWCSARMEAGRDELVGLVKRLDGLYIPDTSRERMTDYEAMRIHVNRDVEVGQRVQRRFTDLGVAQAQNPEPSQRRFMGTSLDPYVESRAAEVYAQSSGRNRKTLAILERSLAALGATKGRKSLILVSEGFIYDPGLQGFRWVADAARRANAAVYFVNAKGLEGMPFSLTAQFGGALPAQDVGFALTEGSWEVEGAEAIASDSGGFSVRDTNDLSTGVKRIADENSSYYLLGYNPTNPARDGAFRKIAVKLAGRKGLEVRARKGYYAPGDDPTAAPPRGEVDPVFQKALDSPYDIGDIPLRMTTLVGEETTLGKARVDVVTEVDLRAVSLEERDGRYAGGVAFLLVAVHRESGELYRYDQKVELNLLPASRERLGRTWFPIRREFELPTGPYEAKIVVRDPRAGRVATVSHRFDVPELGGFRVSTPVLTDTPPDGAPGAEPPAPVARRAFERGEDLSCRFEVYGAAVDPTGVPRVFMGYALKRADGSIVRRVEPAEIRPTSLGGLSRLFYLRLQGTEPGEYELVMAFFDRVSGKSLEIREPFSVLAEGALAQVLTRSGE
jgi:VWFA-related protein